MIAIYYIVQDLLLFVQYFYYKNIYHYNRPPSLKSCELRFIYSIGLL